MSEKKTSKSTKSKTNSKQSSVNLSKIKINSRQINAKHRKKNVYKTIIFILLKLNREYNNHSNLMDFENSSSNNPQNNKQQ